MDFHIPGVDIHIASVDLHTRQSKSLAICSMSALFYTSLLMIRMGRVPRFKGISICRPRCLDHVLLEQDLEVTKSDIYLGKLMNEL